MNYLRFAFVALFCSAAAAFAQTATLSADSNRLAASGGQIVLTATVSYEGEPGALGWAIELPANWSLVSVVGPDAPSVAPSAGTTGTLEFAYTSVPANRAAFSVVVSYPAGAAAANATPTVLVRSAGKLATLKPTAVTFQAGS